MKLTTNLNLVEVKQNAWGYAPTRLHDAVLNYAQIQLQLYLRSDEWLHCQFHGHLHFSCGSPRVFKT